MGGYPFNEQNEHQLLMKELQEVADQMFSLLAQAKTALDQLAEHNNDGVAHADIRRLINESGSASTEFVDLRVQQHDESATAHMVLRNELETKIADLTKARQMVDELIAAHNSESLAHADIREAINAVRAQIGDYDLPTLARSVNELVAHADTVDTQILDLQSVDAKHDAEIHKNRTNITALQTSVQKLEDDLLVVSTGDFVRQAGLDAIIIGQHVLSLNERLGYSQYNEASGSPSLMEFECTLPHYVGRNRTIEFAFYGCQTDATGTVSYTVEEGKGDFALGPNTVSEGQNVTLQMGDQDEPGDLIYFTTTVTAANGQSVKTTVAAMITRPLDMALVSCYGLPANVEPDSSRTYPFLIRNLGEDGTGRFSYELDANGSGLLFDKTTNLNTEEEIHLTVPGSMPRDTDVTFYLIVHDLYGDSQTLEVTIHINAIPGAEDFQHNVPVFAVPGRTYNLKFSGIISADGTPAKYSLQNIDSVLTFDKTSGILANENVKMLVSETAERGQLYGFDVVSLDENNASVTIEQSFSINTLPLADDVTSTLPESTKGGVTLVFKINGGQDQEGDIDTITFDIDPLSTDLGFKKTTGIRQDEEVQVTVPKVATEKIHLFHIYPVDSHGERSATPMEVQMQVDPIYLPDTPYIISPTDGSEVEPIFTITWTAFNMSVDLSSSTSDVVYTF